MSARFDLHIHTSRHSPDSQLNPFRLVRVAKNLGLQGIVITEHDKIWTQAELDELRAATPGIMVFAGVEVSAAEGHFLCYGVKDISKIPAGITVNALCEEMHQQSGAVVAAHPYRWGQDFSAIMDEQKPSLDGVEVMSKNMTTAERQKIQEFLKTYGGQPLCQLGNSDSHEEKTIGLCQTTFTSSIRDEKDLIEALRCGEGNPEDTSTVSLLEVEV